MSQWDAARVGLDGATDETRRVAERAAGATVRLTAVVTEVTRGEAALAELTRSRDERQEMLGQIEAVSRRFINTLGVARFIDASIYRDTFPAIRIAILFFTIAILFSNFFFLIFFFLISFFHNDFHLGRKDT